MRKGTTSAAETWEKMEAYPASETVSILVVDDLPEKLLAYQSILEDLGQDVVCVRSGEEALKRVLVQEFAVILLDVNMPGMDGFETAELIRKRRRSAHTPIIFLTAFTDEIRMAQGYASGAVDYLPTPVVPEILQAKVRVFIELSRMRRKAAAQAEEQARRKAAEEHACRSEFLGNASEVLARAYAQGDLCEVIARLPLPYLADMCFVWTAGQRKPGMIKAWIGAEGIYAAEGASAMTTWLEKAIDTAKVANQKQLYHKVPLSSFMPETAGEKGEITVLVSLLGMRGRHYGALVLVRKGAQAYDAEALSLAEDLVSRINVTLENADLMEKIQEADQRKDEFLAILSHELRNPLAPIRNALSAMRLTRDTALRMEAEETIERQLMHMVHLIDDLTDVSRITKGKIELRKNKVTFGEIMDHAVETAQALIHQQQQVLDIVLPDAPMWLDADPGRLSQVFSNLLNNAAKYTDKGGRIEMRAHMQDNEVVVKISDNGIGIAPEMLSRIFDMFCQVDNSLERARGGLGIGLTLVKSLVEMHGGSIEAHSRGLSQGSEFIVRLPLVQAPKETLLNETQQKETPPSSVPMRILVVDDNEASAKTLGWTIELTGHEVRLAHSGASAIEIAGEWQPRVVLLDIGLPGMNGYDVCKTMRNDDRLKETIIIAQTGWGQTEHRQRSKEAGFDHHLVKPVDLPTLQRLLDQITL